jgi:hypothetical protein
MFTDDLLVGILFEHKKTIRSIFNITKQDRVHVNKLRGPKLVQKFPTLYETHVYYLVHKSPPLYFMTQLNPSHTAFLQDQV